jgi:hypothetical protein
MLQQLLVFLLTLLLRHAADAAGPSLPPRPPVLENITRLFVHGEDGYACVRSPSLVLAGPRLLAIVERWNYSGNHCYPNGIPPVANRSQEWSAYQSFAVRGSDDGGRSWSPARAIELGGLVAWNQQTVFFDGAVLMHVKEKLTGRIFQTISHDLGESWGAPRDISRFFPPALADPVTGMRPSYGHGVVVPSDVHPAGRILMTGYDHAPPTTSCHVSTSADGGASWQMASVIPDAFECGAAWLGGHDVYVNARHKQPANATSPNRRVQAVSPHEGFNATRNGALAPLRENGADGVLGGLTSAPAASEGDPRELFFAMAASSAGGERFRGVATSPHTYVDDRYNLTLHRSHNGGRTWDAHQLWDGYSGYTALALVSESTVGVLWETAAEGCAEACALTFGSVARQ